MNAMEKLKVYNIIALGGEGECEFECECEGGQI